MPSDCATGSARARHAIRITEPEHLEIGSRTLRATHFCRRVRAAGHRHTRTASGVGPQKQTHSSVSRSAIVARADMTTIAAKKVLSPNGDGYGDGDGDCDGDGDGDGDGRPGPPCNENQGENENQISFSDTGATHKVSVMSRGVYEKGAICRRIGDREKKLSAGYHSRLHASPW